jgi:hypothetical protein
MTTLPDRMTVIAIRQPGGPEGRKSSVRYFPLRSEIVIGFRRLDGDVTLTPPLLLPILSGVFRPSK